MRSVNGTSRASAWLLVVGGLALAVSTFLDWYDFFGAGASAWDALRRTDVAVFVAGLVAAASGAWLGFGDVGSERRVVAPLGGAAGVLGAIAVVVRMVSPPGDLSLEAGIYVALVAAILAAIGGLLATGAAWRATALKPPSGPVGPARDEVDKPTGPRTLALQADVPVDDRCDVAKRAYNSARRGRLAYQALVFLLAVVLAMAAIYALISFSDEEQGRGLLGVVAAVGSLLVGGFFGALAKSAADDEEAMWHRVEKCCGGD